MNVLYKQLKSLYSDYRKHVSRLAKISFAYHILITIYPICIGILFLSRIFNINYFVFYSFVDQYISHDLSVYLKNSLNLYKIDFSMIVILLLSIYISAKGIYEIYDISKSMFNAHYNLLNQYIMIIIKTVVLFVMIMFIIILIGVIPIIIIKDIEMLIVLFIMLFVLYLIIPDCYVGIINALIGALCSSVMLWILIKGMQYYFVMSDYSYIYGPLSDIVIILISLSYMGEVFYLGLYIVYIVKMKRS